MTKSNLARIFVLLTLVGYFSKAQDVQLPPSFKICPKTSPNFALCVKDSIEYLRPNLKTGDFGNGFKVRALEPLLIEDIHLERGKGFYFHLNNIKAFKITNFKIEKIRVNPDTLFADVILKIPKVEAFCDYKINLLLGIINVQGQGKMKGFVEEIRGRLKIETAPIYKNGIEYKKITKAQVVLKLHNLVLSIKDLFKDPVLNDVAERLVNQNLPMFMNEIEKSIENSLAKIAYQTGSDILERIPFHQLVS